MAVRPIIRYPDIRLRTPTRAVVQFDTALADLARDLDDTMRAAPGIGIAAPHIGLDVRITVIAPDQGPAQVFVNPKIIRQSDERIKFMEGSISMPGVGDEVERAASVRCAYQDIEGCDRQIDAEGLTAVCLQHEIDQLDGIFWLQRLSRLRRDRIIRRYEKIS